MTDVTVIVKVGGRDYEVACQSGEESFLQSAAALLDNEAQSLQEHIGRMPESQVLLMSGLIVADKSADTLERIAKLEAELQAAQAEVAKLKARPAPEPETVEVSRVPPEVVETLAELAARAESVAAAAEERAGD